MTPLQRADLIARAKQLAVPAVSCVRADIRMDHLFAGVSGEDFPALLLALVVVLAECADPVRLKAVTQAPGDEGMPPQGRADVLRNAHAEYARLKRNGLPIPSRVRILNSEYVRNSKKGLGQRAAQSPPREGRDDAAA